MGFIKIYIFLHVEILFLVMRGSSSHRHCPPEKTWNTEEGMEKYLRVTGSDWEQAKRKEIAEREEKWWVPPPFAG